MINDNRLPVMPGEHRGRTAPQTPTRTLPGRKRGGGKRAKKYLAFFAAFVITLGAGTLTIWAQSGEGSDDSGVGDFLPSKTCPDTSFAESLLSDSVVDLVEEGTPDRDIFANTPVTDELFPDYIVRARLRRSTEEWQAGETLYILEGQSNAYYLVRDASGCRGAVAWEDVTPLPPEVGDLPEVTAEDIEKAANQRGYGGKKSCLVWTNLARLETYIFWGERGKWTLAKRFPCSAGDAAHPTARGQYEIGFRTPAIGKKGRYLCRFALGFHGAYMYHSVLFDPAGETVIDGRLGQRVSHGCIRLSPEDAAWMWEHVPTGAGVVIQ